MIKKFFSYLKWLRQGKPIITYGGFNCGCCGEWIYEKYTIPTYKSCGRWWDTWGLCDKCAKS